MQGYLGNTFQRSMPSPLPGSQASSYESNNEIADRRSQEKTCFLQTIYNMFCHAARNSSDGPSISSSILPSSKNVRGPRL